MTELLEVPSELSFLLELSKPHHEIRKVLAKAKPNHPELYSLLYEIDQKFMQVRELLNKDGVLAA